MRDSSPCCAASPALPSHPKISSSPTSAPPTSARRSPIRPRPTRGGHPINRRSLRARQRAADPIPGEILRRILWPRAREVAPKMSVAIVRLGTPRQRGEGVRLGTVRRPPRGVPKAEYASRDYYDVWLPNLSPSAALVSRGLAAQDEAAWRRFV